MTKLYISTVNILARRPAHISAVATVLATVLLITKTFIVKYYDRRIYIYKNRASIIIIT